MEGKMEVKYEITTFGSTATSALAWYFVPATRLTIDSVYCHFSAAPTVADIFQIAYVPAAGFTYAATIYATDASQTVASTTKDIAWQPPKPLKLKLGDGIKISWTNTSARTYGVTVVAVSNEPS
jgi:hypothetical protein